RAALEVRADEVLTPARQLGVAGRAARGSFLRLAMLHHDLFEVRDHVVAPRDEYFVADTDPEPLDVRHVVEGEVRDDGTADLDRLDVRDRSHASGRSGLPVDRDDLRDLREGGELVGDGRARPVGELPEEMLCAEIVRPDDEPVDLVVEAGARL